MFKKLFLYAVALLSVVGFSQTDSTRTLDLNLEFRPRFEFRDGYRQLPTTEQSPAFFTSSRSRLLIDFKQKKVRFHSSFQDVRVWGQNAASPAVGSLSVFETYAIFPIKNRWEIKLGRQAIELDNGRLFSRANWNQYSRAHDGIRLIYQGEKLKTDFFLFYNQSNFNVFGTSFIPNYYKYLAVHQLEYFKNKWAFTLLNTFDGYQSNLTENTIYVRGTSGGRIQYKTKKIRATLAGYYQYGQLNSGQNISAFYFQPELGFKLKKFRIRLGMEYLSGDDANNISAISHSFSTLYGVAFKFMGHLNYFTSFPSDVNNGGLINPYLFFTYRLSDKVRLKLESHLFFTQNNTLGNTNQVIDPFLAVESDIKIKYLIRSDMAFDFGFSLMKATESLGKIKGGDYTTTPVFSFLMFTWKPTLFHLKQYIN